MPAQAPLPSQSRRNILATLGRSERAAINDGRKGALEEKGVAGDSDGWEPGEAYFFSLR